MHGRPYKTVSNTQWLSRCKCKGVLFTCCLFWHLLKSPVYRTPGDSSKWAPDSNRSPCPQPSKDSLGRLGMHPMSLPRKAVTRIFTMSHALAWDKKNGKSFPCPSSSLRQRDLGLPLTHWFCAKVFSLPRTGRISLSPIENKKGVRREGTSSTKRNS